jgi:tellurite resistance protein
MAAASKELNKFKRNTDAVNRSMNKALGAVGLGLGVAKLTGFLEGSAKAATEDIKSKNLLALALQNTVGATKEATDAAERFIQKTSNQVGVLDDKLRPALATAVRSTGSLAKGTQILRTALDVSAGTGKDLTTVTNAISKAYNGNTGALKKLLPSIKTGGDFMSQLNQQFKGAAKTASMSDPFQGLMVIFDNLKETIGYELVPALQDFYAYLQSPTGQANLKAIANIFIGIAKGVGAVVSFLVQNLALVKSLLAGFIFLKLAIFGMTTAMKLYELATRIAAISTKTLKYALIGTGIGAIIVAVSTLASSMLELADSTDTANSSWQDYQDALSMQSPEFQAAVDKWVNYSDATIEILTDLGQIWADGKLVFDQNTVNANAQRVADAATAMRQALDAEMGKMKTTAEKFRDTVGLAFGTFGKDENSVFNIDVIISKMKRLTTAARGFAENLAKLKNKKVPQAVIDQLVAMGPAQGNIVAKGLLASGSKLSTFLGLSKSLYGTGAQAQAVASTTSNATYEININKAVISASDIIREIRTYEKKTGRKYLVN